MKSEHREIIRRLDWQCDSVPSWWDTTKFIPFKTNHIAEAFIKTYLTSEGIKLKRSEYLDFNSDNTPYYDGDKDLISMPYKYCFPSADMYYAGFLHEIIHSTEYFERTGRGEMLYFDTMWDVFGPRKNQLMEEIIAEIGCLFLMQELGLTDLLEASIQKSLHYIITQLIPLYGEEEETFEEAVHYAVEAINFISSEYNLKGIKKV